MSDWRDVKYNDIFEAEIRGLERRRANDPDFAVADVEGKLRHLRILDGADQGGRGGVQDETLAATLAAHEIFLSQWKSETGEG
ncbi:MAG: hypothetical protein FWB78_08750 [Treponema sp.]|nr:hypothetical protein [Treponema sp.]